MPINIFDNLGPEPSKLGQPIVFGFGRSSAVGLCIRDYKSLSVFCGGYDLCHRGN